MSEGLKWARRLRLELAFEIEKLESGLRKVTEITPQGPVDVTSQVLASQKVRFEQLEKTILGPDPAVLDE